MSARKLTPDAADTQVLATRTALLEVDGIDVFYGPIQALRGVSLQIREGEKVALVGANGAGKSTTLRAISGVVPIRRGEIRFGGARLDGRPPNRIVEAGVAQLPEGRELFFGLSVEDNLRAGFWTQRHSDQSYSDQRERVMDLFPILRERRRQAAGTLSGGEQQMLGVARALMSNPRLLVVDELSLGLAPKIVAQLFDIIREVNTTGTAVLIVEQFVHMALEHTDRAYVLVKGEVALEGNSRELRDDPALLAAYLGESASAAPADVPSPNGQKEGAAKGGGAKGGGAGKGGAAKAGAAKGGAAKGGAAKGAAGKRAPAKGAPAKGAQAKGAPAKGARRQDTDGS